MAVLTICGPCNTRQSSLLLTGHNPNFPLPTSFTWLGSSLRDITLLNMLKNFAIFNC